jgi:hypothetical protein
MKRICKYLPVILNLFFFLNAGFLSYGEQLRAQTILEAENAFFTHGIVDTEHAGYTGTGYVDLENAYNEYITWYINTTDSITQTLDFSLFNGKPKIYRQVFIFYRCRQSRIFG